MLNHERGIIKTEALVAAVAAPFALGVIAAEQANAALVSPAEKPPMVLDGQTRNLPAVEFGRTITVCAAPNSRFFIQQPGGGTEPGDPGSLRLGNSK